MTQSSGDFEEKLSRPLVIASGPRSLQGQHSNSATRSVRSCAHPDGSSRWTRSACRAIKSSQPAPGLGRHRDHGWGSHDVAGSLTSTGPGGAIMTSGPDRVPDAKEVRVNQRRSARTHAFATAKHV